MTVKIIYSILNRSIFATLSFTMHELHSQLRKKINWYDTWHNHPHHQHAHWFGLFAFLLVMTLLVSVQTALYLVEKPEAQAATTVLGISGNRFTVNGQAKFLVLSGYWDGLDAPDPSGDLAYLDSKGFDGIRIFPNLWDYCAGCGTEFTPGNNPVINPDGSINQSRLNQLISIIDTADNLGMIVDVTFARETIAGNCTASAGNPVICISEFKNGVISVINSLRNKTNVFFDLSNEHNHPAIDVSGADISDLKNRIRSTVGSNIILTVSSGTPDSSVAINNAQTFGMNMVNVHWASGTTELNTSLYPGSIISSLPTYVGEPYNTHSMPGYTSSQLINGVVEAKKAGIAAWLFHSDATFLSNGEDPIQFTSTEQGFIDGFSQALQGAIWGGGGTTGNKTTALYCATYNSANACSCYVGGPITTGTKYQTVKNAMNAVLSADPSWQNSTDVRGFKNAVVAYLNANGEISAQGNNGNCNQSDNSLAIQTSTVNGIMMGELYEVARIGAGCNDEQPATVGNSTTGCRPLDPFVGSWDYIGLGNQADGSCSNVCSVIPITPTPAPLYPILTSISPTSGAAGTQVTLTGQNLDLCAPLIAGGNPNPACNVMFFDSAGKRSTAVDGLETSTTTITATVPDCLSAGVGHATVGEVTNQSNALSFTITSGSTCRNRYLFYLYPDTVPVGAPISIVGQVLNETVRFYDFNKTEYVATGTIDNNETEVIVSVPPTLRPGFYTVKVGPSLTDISNSAPLTIVPGEYISDPPLPGPPVITSFDPMTIGQGGTLKIYGRNLPPTVQFIDSLGQTVTILGWVSSGNDIITVGVPAQLIPELYTIGVTGNNGSTTSPDILTVIAGTTAIGAQSTDNVIPQSTTNLGQLISGSLSYAVYGVGVAVFVMILYAGFLWMTSAANPGNIAVAKRYMTNAIIGAVLLLSSYIILYTINPDLVGGTVTLPGISPQPRSSLPPGGANCNNPQALAQQYNVPYPRTNVPELNTLISCANSRIGSMIDQNQIYTYEQSNDLCNYTRGNSVCGTCQHRVNSCHYGGQAGTAGSLGVDFNAASGTTENQLYTALQNISTTCNFGNILFETNHTHVSTQSCSGN